MCRKKNCVIMGDFRNLTKADVKPLQFKKKCDNSQTKGLLSHMNEVTVF